MFTNNTYQTASVISGSVALIDENTELASIATHIYQEIRRKAQWSNFWAKISGRSNKLLALDEIAHSIRITGQSYAGVKVVSILKIIGSEGRSNDFDQAIACVNLKLDSIYARFCSQSQQSNRILIVTFVIASNLCDYVDPSVSFKVVHILLVAPL